MKRAAHMVSVLAVLFLLVEALGPSLTRYAIERPLAETTSAISALAAEGRVMTENAALLEQLAARARATSAVDSADQRGLIAAGTALLVAGKPAAARGEYRAALARGERAEIDLNLARAYALEGRKADAEAALLRAVWLSPMLIGSLPENDRPRLEAALADLAARLQSGELTAPPPLPAEE